ncbi:hypothetical protein WJX72_006201 [[Myrmecia] bisecta]|uniref:Methyltransferase domain-containing protein n=1 Tax=[Myrmecia] bisecta TaxID=41462 RepID=A0AAW1QR06_9CHLO
MKIQQVFASLLCLTAISQVLAVARHPCHERKLHMGHYDLEAACNLTAWRSRIFEDTMKLYAKTARLRHAAGNKTIPEQPEDPVGQDAFQLFEPVLACRGWAPLEQLGDEGLQGKWICNVADMKAPCLVFSLGSFNDYAFEEAILQHTPCEVHTYDCTVDGNSSPRTPQRMPPRAGSAPKLRSLDEDSVASTPPHSQSGYSPTAGDSPYPRSAIKERKTSNRALNSLMGLKRMSYRDKGAAKSGEDGKRGGHKRSQSGAVGGGRKELSKQMVSQMVMFEKGMFDLESDLQGLSEKGIDTLRSDLAAIDAECAEEIKKTVHEHYHQFIHASQGISKLDGEMQQLRNLLNNTNALVASLKDVAAAPAKPARYSLDERDRERAGPATPAAWRDGPEGLKWTEALEELDVAIAEWRPVEALQLLKKADKAIAKPAGGNTSGDQHAREGRAEKQKAELDERRARLVRILEGQLAEASTSSSDVRLCAGVLAAVAGKAHAHRLLLELHTARLKRQQQLLLKPQNTGGGDADGTEYAGALAQKVFRAIGVAADDVAAVFGEDAYELGALFMVWALQETERCALLLKRHALSPFAAPAGLGATVSCCVLALVHCMVLEDTHGLKLAPRLMRELWPACEQVLQRRLRRIGDDLKRNVAAEVDRAAAQAREPQQAGPATGWGQLMEIFPSADDLLDEVQAMVAILAPLAGPRVAQAVRKGFADLFGLYTAALLQGFLKYRAPDGSYPAGLEAVVEPAMETVGSMSAQFLPELTAPLVGKCGGVCDAAALADHVEALATGMGLMQAGPDGT